MEKLYDNRYKRLKITIATLWIVGIIVYTMALFNFILLDKPKEAVKEPIVQVSKDIIAVADTTTDMAIEKQRNKHITLSRGGDVPTVKPISERDRINGYVREICNKYNIDPYMVMSMIVSESNYNPRETTGICLGLMQVSTKWHKERASRLGITNFYDPYSNILLGVDYLSELFKQYKDPRLVLMMYNMNHDTALSMYKRGEISYYARSVLARADEYRRGE